MPIQPLRCGRCHAPLRGPVFNLGTPERCPSCRARIQVHVFPALFSTLHRTPAALPRPADAVCFIHSQKAAAATCSRCARPICALCELEVDDKILCPSCANEPKGEGALGPLQTETILYDRLALLLGFWPLILIFTLWICWPVYLLTAAATFYVVLRHWHAPPLAFIPRPQAHMVLAAALGVLQLAVAAGFAWLTYRWISYLWS